MEKKNKDDTKKGEKKTNKKEGQFIEMQAKELNKLTKLDWQILNRKIMKVKQKKSQQSCLIAMANSELFAFERTDPNDKSGIEVLKEDVKREEDEFGILYDELITLEIYRDEIEKSLIEKLKAIFSKK